MANLTNTGAEKPVDGGSYDNWGTLILTFWAILDKMAGDTETIATTSGTVTLTQSQSNALHLDFTGTLTGNLTVDTLASGSRFWLVSNNTSGAYMVTFQVAGGGGDSVTVDQGKKALVLSDGTDCLIFDLETLSGELATASIANSAVTTAKIADANVTTAKIADSNVTTAKIADSNVTTAKIANSNVTTAKIADANVTTAKILDNNVTLAKLATLANMRLIGNVSGSTATPAAVTILDEDDMASDSATALTTQQSQKAYIDATAFSAALPSQAGNSGKFVTTNGSVASWVTPAASAVSVTPAGNISSTDVQAALEELDTALSTVGGMTQLATSGDLSTPAATVEFTSIDQSYATLRISFIGVSHNDASSQNFTLQFSNDNGSTWSSLTTVLSQGSIANSIAVYSSVQFWGYADDTSLVIYKITDQALSDLGNDPVSAIPVHLRHDGGINAIKIFPNSGSFDAGEIILYGA